MTRGGSIALAVTALVVVAIALLAGAVLVWVLPQHLGSVVIDGRTLDLQHAHGGHWLLASLGVLIALVVCLVVVPLVALIATLVPLLGALVAVLLALAAVAVVCSPLILLGWWLWKRSNNKATMPA